jgi:uncharacterized protein YabE (DUF348 family)/3D (Asp-Asp-Asp) domain-containing protein
LTGEPFRARLYPKDALPGRLEGVNTPPAFLVNPRRILHLLLVLLVAGGVALLFLVGPAGKRGRSTAPELTIGQALELDGHIATNSDGDDESISIAAASIEPMDEEVPAGSNDESITIAAVGIEPMGEPVPLVLHQDGLSVSTVSAASTVGEVLAEEGVVVEPGDYLFPSAGSLVTAGTHIYIYRARELFLSVGGDTTTVHSRKATVAAVLDEAGVSLGTLDRVEPALDAPVEDGLTIRVVQVREEFETVEEVIPLSVVYQDDPTMDMGQYMVMDWGADGLIHREYRAVYEDGQEIERELLNEWEQPPSDQIIAQGTKPVNLVETPQGPLRYAYSLEMYATWYRPASCGRSPDSPWYGIAATGLIVERGIVAVDPNVISLGTRLYVPGYGQALAADTGSAVIGNIIDLGFADHEVPDWSTRWVTVYILE